MDNMVSKTYRASAAVEHVPATEAKNEFGRVLDVVLAGGRVVITKHDVPRAVMLSAEQYAELTGEPDVDLDALDMELESLLEAMQAPRARAATDALFAASSSVLSKAAVGRAARKRPVGRRRG